MTEHAGLVLTEVVNAIPGAAKIPTWLAQKATKQGARWQAYALSLERLGAWRQPKAAQPAPAGGR